jgi:dTDP-4-dehydrorhamnose reductase
MRSKYLVTGAKGMLGRAIVHALHQQEEQVTAADLPEHDLSSESQVQTLFKQVKPTHLIHCAAYTNVDGAESNADLCHKLNVTMPGLLAAACVTYEARMLMISTDYVFDGEATSPYPETASPNPKGVYAVTKWEGEKVVASILERHQIVRTAWLYGPGKNNFVSSMYERLNRGQRLRVIDDRFGSPTYSLDLADRLPALSRLEAWGVFHLVNAGVATWFGLTRQIALAAGFDPEQIEPISAVEYPTPAPRPRYTALDCSRAWALGIEPMRDWHEAVDDYVKNHLMSDAQAMAKQ